MNAPTTLPQPLREDSVEGAHRKAISIHCPNCSDMEMAARVDLAMMRDAASSGMYADVFDSTAVILGQIANLASQAVHAPLRTGPLMRVRFATWYLLEACRASERALRQIDA